MVIKNAVEQRVYYADTDHGGVAYYAAYLRWFEIGRTELLRDLGIGQKELDDENILLPVVEVKCEYKAPAVYNDVVSIQTTMEKVGNKSIVFDYVIERKQDSKILAKGYTVNVFADSSGSVEIPKKVREKLERG